MSGESLGLLASDSSSGLTSPSTGEGKHIHFNEQVEQCIALEMTGDEDEEIGADSKTIVTLPSTTLKYREDKPRSPETSVKHSNGWWNGRERSTVPPPNPLSSSTRISIESWEDGGTDMDWQPPSLNGDASDISIPYEDEEDVVSEGLLRKVVDVVNTAKDIAYLLWNTGLSKQSWKEGERKGNVRFVLEG
jgi:hypothetical protein